MEFINIGTAYIRGGWWQKLKQRNKMTQIAEFRVAMTCTCTYTKDQYSITRPRQTSCALTVGAISGPHSHIGPLLCYHFTNRGYMVGKKHSGKADQSTLASGGSENAWLLNFSVAISWDNKINFSLCVNMSGFCSDSHI